MNLITTMRLNAASCIIFGALLATIPATVASFLSPTPAPAQLITIVGIILVLNGVHIVWAARTMERARKWRAYFSLGDFLWVAATIVLVASRLWITTETGIVAAIAIAVMVGFFGVRQLRASN